MHITVAICTWNRAPLLAQTLTAMTALRVPERTTWELLVVDNNSTDDTAATIATFEGRLPIRRLVEPTPGVSHARNLATIAASGEYLLCTDDDVLVEPCWLGAYVAAFIRRPAAGFFGGVIRPWFPNDPPEWLRRGFDHVAVAYASLDYGPEEVPLSGRRFPFGANMAFRIKEQRAFPYDPSLGPRPGGAVRGEETDVFRRMEAQGIEGWWVPEAIVRHYIPPERQSIAYLREYFMGYGQYLAQTAQHSPAPRLFGRPRWMWRSALENETRYRLGRLFGAPEQWVLSLKNASVMWGQFLHS
jgi:glycosyltransferase involved in cell wall biosynthesis